MHTYIHAYIHAYMHTYIRIHTYAYIHTCIHAYMHTCIHAYMHTCIHAYYMHTCIYIYKYDHYYNQKKPKEEWRLSEVKRNQMTSYSKISLQLTKWLNHTKSRVCSFSIHCDQFAFIKSKLFTGICSNQSIACSGASLQLNKKTTAYMITST